MVTPDHSWSLRTCHLHVTGTRDALWIVTVLTDEAPTHVGRKKSAAAPGGAPPARGTTGPSPPEPPMSKSMRGTWAHARRAMSTALTAAPLKTSVARGAWGRVSDGEKRSAICDAGARV
jgi:hypothetical protein